jgi:hypothetical protein
VGEEEEEEEEEEKGIRLSNELFKRVMLNNWELFWSSS